MPPEGTLIDPQKLCGTQILATSHTEPGYELLFDSFIQSAGKGIRGPVISARQMLFRIGAVFVDVEVRCEANSDRGSLVGQMLDSSNPGRPLAGVSVSLLNRGRSVVSTSSNENGEFQFQFLMKSELELSVELDHGRPVYLRISNPLGANLLPSQAKRQPGRNISSAAGA